MLRRRGSDAATLPATATLPTPRKSESPQQPSPGVKVQVRKDIFAIRMLSPYIAAAIRDYHNLDPHVPNFGDDRGGSSAIS
ncbi:hypothetical protein FRC01_003237, partial [Tulasnella sp. 417]